MRNPPTRVRILIMVVRKDSSGQQLSAMVEICVIDLCVNEKYRH